MTFLKSQMAKQELYFVDEARAISELGEVEHLPGSETLDIMMSPVWVEEHTTICYPL